MNYWPISGTRNTSCLRWTIPHSNKGQYVPVMNQLVLAPDLKITNRAKTDIPPVSITSGPCNNFMFSIFGSLRISYNTTTVLKLDHYPIYNYLRMKLNCDNNDLGTWATTRCYYDEGPTDNLDTVNTAGWSRRRKLFGGIVKTPRTIRNDANTADIANPELNKFKYG